MSQYMSIYVQCTRQYIWNTQSTIHALYMENYYIQNTKVYIYFMEYYTYYIWCKINTILICESIYNIKSNMNAMCESNTMCKVEASTNMSGVKVVILIWDILELMLFLHHNARSLFKKQGPTNNALI
jgi:hypothetical protein